MGGSGRPHLHHAVIEFAQRYPTWCPIDSQADHRKILQTVGLVGVDRVCYGSDAPLMPMRYEWDMRRVIYQGLTREDLARALGENLGRLLGLS